jgi:predicted dehydrogenase
MPGKVTHSLDVVLIGCGAAGLNLYRKPLQKLEKARVVRVVGLVDANVACAKRLQVFFPRAGTYEGLDCIQALTPDLTIIATPPALHAEHSTAALQAGSHVLCEKPMATTGADAMRMVETADACQRLLAVGLPRRFYPSLVRLRRLIEGDGLGMITHFSYAEGGRFSWPVMTEAIFQREKAGGGILLDLGTHVLDTLIWLFGTLEPLEYADDALLDGVECDCVLTLKTASGSGDVHLSWANPLTNRMEVRGTSGVATVGLMEINGVPYLQPGMAEMPLLEVSFPSRVEAAPLTRSTPQTYEDCIYLQLIQMIRAILYGEQPAVTGREAAEVVKIIERSYVMAKARQMNWLPPQHQEAVRRLHWRARS